MAPLALTTLSRCAALPSVRLNMARQSRMIAAPVRRLSSAVVRAQAEKEGEGQGETMPVQQQRQQAPKQQALSTVSPWETMPSFGRMGQMMRSMEEEMNQLARAFGMPSVSLGMPSSLFETALPASTAAARVPAFAKALAVDIKDTGNALEIAADVPGLSKEDIKIQVSPDRVLTISGERKTESKEGSEEEGVLRIERSYGSFHRSFRLPDNVDLEGIKAVTKDGVLRLTVPKTEEAKPKQIDIQVASE